MKYPNLWEEKRLWKKGFKFVACVDEVGRGSLAGPVVAAAVISNLKSKNQKLKSPRTNSFGITWGRQFKIKDSKKLKQKRREEFYKILTKHPAIKWGIGIVSERIIDKINIFQATRLAMKRAVNNLKSKIQNPRLRHPFAKGYGSAQQGFGGQAKSKIDYLILDGKMKLDLSVLQKSIIKADEKVFSCAAASIIAKVIRDRIMTHYHKKYPFYGFDLHKGYGTKLHFNRLNRYGPCKIHRKTFRLIH